MKQNTIKYDIVVVGGGHAGIEAAYAASKKKLTVLLITGNIDLIGQLSCNPSIGGVSKGNIVREIDALGGTMAKNIDETGIHYKMLNKSKGMAVWGNRAQADKEKYRNWSRLYLEKVENIDILQGLVVNIELSGQKVKAVILDSGQKIYSHSIVLTNGTFLNGKIHIGLNSFESGRLGEPPSLYLSDKISDLGIKKGRLKTGTSPRLDGTTINFSKFEVQLGDDDPWKFSFSTRKKIKNKKPCWIGKTNSKTHEVIMNSLGYSPLYSGKIKSIGPKYCPSIEDKIVRFGEREGHSLFLEPESLENSEYYINGLSTSLPFDVQYSMLNTIPGLKDTKIIRPGYAVEYDYFLPNQLYHTLESKVIENLYFAGQINGTSGYEEAAGQGLIAGINAALKIKNEDPLILGRETSYIGVMIDDLTTKGTSEPYRMFTSRAEYRILLRQDNTNERLMDIALKNELITKNEYSAIKRVSNQKVYVIKKLKMDKIKDTKNKSVTIYKYLQRPESRLHKLKNKYKYLSKLSDCKLSSIEADIKYDGFIKKERKNIEELQKIEKVNIPSDLDVLKIQGILLESRKKIKEYKPTNLGQVSRIPGITPSDVFNLAIYISNHHFVSRETSGKKDE